MSSNTHAAMLVAVEQAGLGWCPWEFEDCGMSQVKGKGLMHTFLYRVSDAAWEFLLALRDKGNQHG
jgi:hypothetical protein